MIIGSISLFVILVICLLQVKVRKRFYKKEPVKIEYELNVDSTEVDLVTSDNVKIYGLLTKPENPSAILICVHGFKASHLKYIAIMEEMYKQNIACLSIDLRSHNKSDGKYIKCGYQEHLDVSAAVEYAENNFDVPIILVGHSMGGAVVMSSYSKEVKGIVNVAGFASFHEVATLSAPKLLRPIYKLSMSIYLITTCKVKDFTKPTKKAKNINCPILLLHDKYDEDVPFSEAKQYMQILKDKDIKLISFEDHTHNPLLKSYRKGIINEEAFEYLLKFVNDITNAH